MRDRTADLMLTMHVLYLLSYGGQGAENVGRVDCGGALHSTFKRSGSVPDGGDDVKPRFPLEQEKMQPKVWRRVFQPFGENTGFISAESAT